MVRTPVMGDPGASLTRAAPATPVGLAVVRAATRSTQAKGMTTIGTQAKAAGGLQTSQSGALP